MSEPTDPFAASGPGVFVTRNPSTGGLESSTGDSDFAQLPKEFRDLIECTLESSTGDGDFTPDNSLNGDRSSNVAGFRILGEIDHGGMGVVYRAYDLALNRTVAVKVVQDRYRDSPAAVARFLEEAQITGQLQHPGIPPVHQVGTLPDDRPFLAMKLIQGRTLANLLKDGDWDRGQALGVFEQICHAVAYAHDHGVIHRDLKPQNVMVGRFNEVQVMDWGLAKVRSTNPDDSKVTGPEATFHDPRAGAFDFETRAGSVVGTPAYIPPEQAIGALDKVTERSDVFGLGAILCALLTGKAPYVGTDAESTRKMAARGKLDDAHSRLTASGADPELVALCRQCLSPEPADRPTNAGEVAKAVAGLRAAADERARQAEISRARAQVHAAEQTKRRRVGQIAGGGVALVLLAGLGVSLWQMKRAIGAEQKVTSESIAKDEALTAANKARADEAEAHRRAFAALDSMTEVFDKRFAQAVVLTDDDKAFIRGIIAQFDAFAAIQGDDANSRAMRAMGRFRVGWMRYRLGELKEAEADNDAALALFKQLAADFPDRLEFRVDLARSHNNRGNLLSETGRPEEAERDYDAALAIRKQLAADFPTDPEVLDDLAGSHNNRSILLHGTGRLKQAERDYDAALAIRKRLAADFPDRPEFRQNLAASHNNRSNLLNQTGRPKEAAADSEAALDILKQLAIDFPARPEFRANLAGSHNIRGNRLGATGRPNEAEQEYDAALAIHKQLAADFPIRPEFRQELARSHANRGMLLRAAGRLKEVERDYDAALAIRKQLAADFPARPEFRRDLASSYLSRGLLLRATGRSKQAEQEYDAAAAIYNRLVADFPDRPEFRQDLATTHNNRGNLLRDAGRLREAERDYAAALPLRKQLAADFPDQPDLRNELAGTCVNLALLHQQQGDLAAAERLLLEGRPHHLAALNANPRNPSYRQFYRNHLSVLSGVYAGLLEKDEAVRTAETRRDMGWDPPADAYDSAGFLSQCIPIVAKHAKLDDAQRKEAAQFYTDAALKQLREAVGRGFKNAVRLKSDLTFAPLWGQAEFRKVLAELGAMGK